MLKLYLGQREKEGELADDAPLLVKRNGKMLDPKNVQKIMRAVNAKVGDQIPEAKRVQSGDINPLSLKYLRRAFSNACRSAGVPRVFREYWLGHAPPYNGAYAGQLPIAEQRKAVHKISPYLSVTGGGDIQEDLRKQQTEIESLKVFNRQLASDLTALSKNVTVLRSVLSIIAEAGQREKAAKGGKMFPTRDATWEAVQEYLAKYYPDLDTSKV